MKLLEKLTFALGASLLTLNIGCSPTSPVATEGRVKISIRSAGNSASNSLAKLVNAVSITSARVVIEEVEFESSNRDSMDFELEQPFVQDLAVDTSLHEITTIQLPFGTYEEMEIEIGRLDQEDGAAFTQNPDLQNLSVRVEGFLDNDPTKTFTFSSDLSAEQEREFDPALIVDATSPSTNIVLMIDLGRWFVDNNNNPLDPTLAQNQNAIERNIKASIKVFEDDDDNGEDDDDDDGDDGNDDDNDGDDDQG